MNEKLYAPEGGRVGTPENQAYLATPAGLERAMNTGAIIEGIAVLCDNQMRLHVALHCA